MTLLQKEYKGILLSVFIGLSSYFASDYVPSFLNGILLALLFGIFVGNIVNIPQELNAGIHFTSSKMLELSILFLAFSINYSHIASLGIQSFSFIVIMVLAMLLLTYYLAIQLKCPGSTGWLVGFGTTICGSSAIAALAPSITKNKEDIGIAMAVVNLFGTLGMIIMPLILIKFDLNATKMGLLIGGTLHSVGNVAGSGYAISKEVGEAAITIKLARVAMLSPALIFFNFLVNRKNIKNIVDYFKLPWYLWSFIGITIASSMIHFSSGFLSIMEHAGKIILTIAMAAIGLKVSFKTLYQSGQKGVFFGLVIFLVLFLIMSVFVMFM